MKKIKTKYSKCDTDCKKAGTIFVEGGQSFYFCAVCASVLEKIDGCQRVYLFLQDSFPDKFSGQISPEDRNILSARIRRKNGTDPWLVKNRIDK